VTFSAENPPAADDERSPGADPAAAERPDTDEPPAGEAAAPEEPGAPASDQAGGRTGAPNMLPGRERRGTWIERALMRLIATAGIIGIGVAIAAIMHSSGSKGWITGLVVSIVTVVLSAILWSSRQL
jgi:hypothetical protein